MTDKELYAQCLHLSTMIKKYRNQFIALLPEVEKRKLYHRYGMYSIYEFAAKLGCISNDTVNKVLKLEEKLKNKPLLKSMFQSGEVGWSKVNVAVKIPIPEEELAQKLPTISKKALEVWARESKNEANLTKENNFYPGVKSTKQKEKFSIEMDSALLAQLRVVKQKLEKETKKPLSWEQTLKIMVNKMQEPAKSVRKVKKKLSVAKSTSRYIPKAVKERALKKTNQLCAKCNKPAEHLHHQVPYSISKSHESIIPLCKAHHDLVHHTGDTYVNKKYQRHKIVQMRL